MSKNKSYLYGLAVLAIIILTIIFYPTPKTGNQTTDTLSTSFNSKKERIDFLENYLNLPTEIEDTAYHIVYYSGSGIGMGAKEWDFRIIAKLSPENLKKWLENAKESPKAFDLSWAKELLPQDWQIKSEPKYYLRSGELSVFEPEGIIFWKISSIDR